LYILKLIIRIDLGQTHAGSNAGDVCKKWAETVAFYRERLGLPVNFANDWFFEFCLTDGSRLSIADESRASVKSCGGLGITLALETDSIETVWADLAESGPAPTEIKEHPWGALPPKLPGWF